MLFVNAEKTDEASWKAFDSLWDDARRVIGKYSFRSEPYGRTCGSDHEECSTNE